MRSRERTVWKTSRPTPTGGAEDQSDGLENQQAEPEQQSEPEDQPPEGGNDNPPEQAEQPVQTVPLVFNGQQIMLPAEGGERFTGRAWCEPGGAPAERHEL